MLARDGRNRQVIVVPAAAARAYRLLMKEELSLGLLITSLLASTMTIPWSEAPLDPCHVGAILGAVTVATLTVTFFSGERARRVERPLLAIFLAGMPLPYILNLVWYGGSTAWLALELSALPVYGAVALAGLRNPRILAAGIAAHGLLWDAWHLGHTPMPPWYAFGCLVVDLTMALYVLVRMSRPAELSRLSVERS
jgi:hypothetical protein